MKAGTLRDAERRESACSLVSEDRKLKRESSKNSRVVPYFVSSSGLGKLR